MTDDCSIPRQAYWDWLTSRSPSKSPDAARSQSRHETAVSWPASSSMNSTKRASKDVLLRSRGACWGVADCGFAVSGTLPPGSSGMSGLSGAGTFSLATLSKSSASNHGWVCRARMEWLSFVPANGLMPPMLELPVEQHNRLATSTVRSLYTTSAARSETVSGSGARCVLFVNAFISLQHRENNTTSITAA